MLFAGHNTGVLNSYDLLRCVEFPSRQVMCDLLIIIVCAMNDSHGRSLGKSIGRATETIACPEEDIKADIN